MAPAATLDRPPRRWSVRGPDDEPGRVHRGTQRIRFTRRVAVRRERRPSSLAPRPCHRAGRVAHPHHPRPGRPVVNTVTTASGRVRACCEFRGRMSRPVALVSDGRLSLFDLPRGWSEAPFRPTFTHPDGSTGSLWQCPACRCRLERGEGLPSRADSAPEPEQPSARDEHVRRMVDAAPPLTLEQRDRLVVLLRASSRPSAGPNGGDASPHP